MTWGQLRFALQSEAGDGISLDLIDGWLNGRYETILKAADWTGVRAHLTLVTLAAYQSAADTCTLTVGSQTVTGSGTAWDDTRLGQRFYRPGDAAVYTVTGVASATSLTLERPYEGIGSAAPATVQAGSAYVFMQNVYQLSADCGTVQSILDPLSQPLCPFSEARMDMLTASRALLGDPMAWDPYDDSDPVDGPVLHQVELYPPPLYARGLQVTYIRAAIGFDGENTDGSPLPWISDVTLLEGCRADLALRQEKLAKCAVHETKFQKQLAQDLLKEFRGRPQASLAMADRFTRHRLARSERGRSAWRGGTPGGPN